MPIKEYICEVCTCSYRSYGKSRRFCSKRCYGNYLRKYQSEEINPRILSEFLSYDPDTGIFTWKKSPKPGINAGDIAGHDNGSDYVTIGFNFQNLAAHIVAWAIYYGVWPERNLDHTDGDKTNNRIKNLRFASRVQNSQNRKKRTDNTSGAKGVNWHKHQGKWTSRITVDKKRIALGYFERFEEAVIARQNAAKKYFGEFARDEGLS